MRLVKRLTNSEEIPNFAAETKQVKRFLEDENRSRV